MKFLKAIAALGFIAISFFSCQKELSFDGGSLGAFRKDASGGCLPVVINGVFQADTLLLANKNYVDVEVIASIGGSFTIKSDTVNGYSFSKSGNLGSGVNTIRLYASGKPIAAGNNIFTIKYGSSTCSFTIPVAGSATGGAIYTLGGAPGACSGVTLGATPFTQGTALGAGNTATIQVNVTQIGTYTLGAAGVNGMIFTATGTFTATGIQNVTLSGNGIPLMAGPSNITASNGTSNCTFTVTVLPAGATAAVFTLNGTPGACSGAMQNGTYVAGTPLTASNTVTINVTVATLGTYTITTTLANGMAFGASGVFTVLGSQPINLLGTGIPVAAGINNFTATAGISTCTFSVTTTATPPPPNTDYVPQTTGTNFSLRLVGGLPSDTAYFKVSANNFTIGANSYRIFEQQDVGVPVDSFFHRKNGGLYYKYYDDSYGFDSPINVDGLILDSSLAVNVTWTTLITGNTIGGMFATGGIIAKITAKGASATVASIPYTNIIKVTYTHYYNLGAGNVNYYLEEVWYAKGKGVIYNSLDDIPSSGITEYETTRIEVL